MKDDGTIFGMHPVMEAIEAGKPIDKLFLQKGLQGENINKLRSLLKERDIKAKIVPVEKLNRLTRKNHQGVFAFVSPIDFYSLEMLLPQLYEEGKNPLLLILDRVSDVRNFGAIVRTAECVGVNAVIIPKSESAPISADALKTSAGALFRVPICKEQDLKKTVSFLQMSGVQVICATEKTNKDIYQVDLTTPTAIVMGSEEDGISHSILRIADENVKLPMSGGISSLNVSVACGVFLYETVRQRQNLKL